MKIKKYIEISLSQVGVNEDSGILQEWLVEEGQFISVGTIICEFETTKTLIEIESENEGYIIPVVAESVELKVGDTIAIMVSDKKYIKNAKTKYSKSIDTRKEKIDQNYKITRKAKELIEKHNIDISSLSFNKGIIRTEDIMPLIDESDKQSMDYKLTIDPKSKPLIIYGAGKGAITLFEAIQAGSNFDIVCFVDDDKLHEKSLLDLPVFQSSELNKLKNKGIKLIACEIMNGKTRLRIKNSIEKLGFELINVIHSNAHISNSVIMGKGNYVKSSATIETNTTIGNCCIIDNGSVIAHDNQIGNGCHIAPGASLGSSISIGDFTVIGIGSCISTNVTIGKNCIISVGSSVTKNVPDNSIVEGVPGKIVGKVKK